MADLGVTLTDARMEALMQRLDEVYTEAYQIAIRNNQEALERLTKIKAEVESGKYDHLTQAQRNQMIKNQAMQQIRTEQIAENIANDINNVGPIAEGIIRGELGGMYALNYDFGNYSIQRQSGLTLNFSQFDQNQIAVLMSEGESPFTKIAFENLGQNPLVVRRLQNELIKATLLGESQYQIIQRIKKVTGMSTEQARRVAQTERTRVQTQGRFMSIIEAEQMGIEMDKQWIARMINTRDSHQEVNEEIVAADEPFSNGLMYPGDPSAPAEEVVNCYCYLKPMVRDAGRALATHRAWVASKSFQEYRDEVG